MINRGFASFILIGSLTLGACGGTTSPDPHGGTALDGVWDLTSYANSDVTGSSVTISDGKLSGNVTVTNEAGACPRVLEFVFEGESMRGKSAPAATCSVQSSHERTLSGTRTAKEAGSTTPWAGTWMVQEGGSSKQGLVVISGLTATSGDFKLTIVDDVATATGPSRYSFIARRR